MVLEDAILRAALDEIQETGYAALRMERVAARASTSKAALYRRWPTRAALVVAAYARFTAEDLVPPDTGALRSDVIALLRLAIAHAVPIAPLILGLLAETEPEQELGQQVRSELAQLRPELLITLLDRAVARGEISAEPLPERVVTLPLDLLRSEILLSGSAVPDSAVVEIVDDVFLPLLRRPTC